VTLKNKNKSLEDVTAEDLLNRLEKEVAQTKVEIKSQLPQQFKNRKERLSRLQDEIMKTPKTEDDVRILDDQSVLKSIKFNGCKLSYES